MLGPDSKSLRPGKGGTRVSGVAGWALWLYGQGPVTTGEFWVGPQRRQWHKSKEEFGASVFSSVYSSLNSTNIERLLCVGYFCGPGDKL